LLIINRYIEIRGKEYEKFGRCIRFCEMKRGVWEKDFEYQKMGMEVNAFKQVAKDEQRPDR